MDNGPSAQLPAGKKEYVIDPVKAQGILTSLTQKERTAAKLWPTRWGFYTKISEIQEDEAIKLGMTPEEYRYAVESLNCQPDPKQYPVAVLPSPAPLPRTSSAMVGRRAQCSLEMFGKLVTTARDVPTRPPLPPGQVYDPYKQTMIFLGIDCGDPISYKLPPQRCEVPTSMLSKPHCLDVAPLSEETLINALKLSRLN